MISSPSKVRIGVVLAGVGGDVGAAVGAVVGDADGHP